MRVATLRNVAGLEQLGIQLLLHEPPDVISECIHRFGCWEVAETRFVIETLKPGMTAFDLGANIGYYTTIFAKCVGPQGRVWAFEPDDENHRLLMMNVERNDLSNVTVKKVVVGEAAGVATLRHHDATNRGGHMAIPTGGPQFSNGSTEHPKVALDDLLPTARVDMIKMDTQGSEPLIIQGARRLIERNRGHLVMIVEFVPLWLRLIHKIDPMEFYRELLALGPFTGSYIHQGKQEVLPVGDMGELLKVVERADGETWPKDAAFADLILQPA